MPRIDLRISLCAIFIAFALCACAPLQQYRTNYNLCVSDTALKSAKCEAHALQEYRDASDPKRGYMLGFIEFDDQGLLFDREQLKAVEHEIITRAAEKDLLITVFVHGWKHSAAPGDENIKTFRKVLLGLSEAESMLSDVAVERRREVVGVYLGWRGSSITAPWLKELTFWDRKETAHKVGHVGMTEVLNRLERIKQDRDSMIARGNRTACPVECEPAPDMGVVVKDSSRTRFTVVGHSFGGAAVFTALSQILEAGFIQTLGPSGVVTDTAGFGNLVVLINPAFEALLYAPLSDMSTERSYFPAQLPVLAVLTSEADGATRIAFPMGRSFSTFFEKERYTKRKNNLTKREETIDEEQANITALGHFEPYRTHFLRATEPLEGTPAKQTAASSVGQFFQASEGWKEDKPGHRIVFSGSTLERTRSSAGRNPYLIVRVDRELIPSHNDISDPRVIEFIKQLILISSQTPKQEKAMEMRASDQLQ